MMPMMGSTIYTFRAVLALRLDRAALRQRPRALVRLLLFLLNPCEKGKSVRVSVWCVRLV
jgi:hypothetical protein